MCLAVPGRLVEATGDDALRMGKVDFGGVQRQASLIYVPEAKVGDYVLVHVGFALSVIDEESAKQTLADLALLGESLDGGLGAEERSDVAPMAHAPDSLRRVPADDPEVPGAAR